MEGIPHKPPPIMLDEEIIIDKTGIGETRSEVGKDMQSQQKCDCSEGKVDSGTANYQNML